MILNVVPAQAADIDALRAATVVFSLTPVALVGNKPLVVSSGTPIHALL